MKKVILILTLLLLACEETPPEKPFNPPMAARRYMTDLGYTVIGVACSTGECVVRVSELPAPIKLDCPDFYQGHSCRLSPDASQKLEVTYPPSITVGPNGASLHLPM